jgi:UDP-GlcNAc:undecaprenyl-phosphate GlcNAc-1-phosphate transferase
MINYLGPLLISFLLGLVITKLTIIFAQKINLIDWPDQQRKFHYGGVPLLGGLAVFLTVIAAFAINKYVLDLSLSVFENKLLIAAIITGTILLFGGFLDDKFKLSPRYQFLFVCLAVIIIITAGLRINFISNPFGGIIKLNNNLFAMALTAVWLLGTTYTTKLLDGVDGLAVGICLIGGLGLFFVSLNWDRAQAITPQLALLFVGACFGFLFWNFWPAKIFLGEGGSTLLGFWLGILAVISGAKIATALAIMAVPVVDVALVITQRLLKKQSPFTHADRKHLHFRLLDAGFKPKQVVTILYLVAVIAGLVALFIGTVGKIILFFLLTFFTVAMVWYLISRYDNKKIL